MSDKPVVIDHFSDVLCVWAYVAQIRIDELQREFADQVEVNYHFIPLFAVTEKRIGDGWQDKGGYTGFGRHVREVCAQFEHVEVHSEVWQGDIPKSSANAHLFLKALQVLGQQDEISTAPRAEFDGRNLFEEATWRLRQRFFRDNHNITQREYQLMLAEEMGLPTGRIAALLQDGTAIAALCRDIELCKEYSVGGSPTYVLNEGRQKLYGNVGYKIIAANVQEVLRQPDAQASWC